MTREQIEQAEKLINKRKETEAFLSEAEMMLYNFTTTISYKLKLELIDLYPSNMEDTFKLEFKNDQKDLIGEMTLNLVVEQLKKRLKEIYDELSKI